MSRSCRVRCWCCDGEVGGAGMANERHVDMLLRDGVAIWNTWRKEEPNIRPDLTGTDLSKADLTGTDLSKADLSEANLFRANLTRADLSGANLSKADLTSADLTGAT